jgi:hypothetical protein
MNLLFTSAGYLTLESQESLDLWRKLFHNVEFIPIARLTSYLRLDPASSFALVDAIVCDASEDFFAVSPSGEPNFFSYVDVAISAASEVADLPHSCAMFDGRKWKSIPFIVLARPAGNAAAAMRHKGNLRWVYGSDPFQTMKKIEAIIEDDRNRILDDYQNLGMLVRFAKGRTQIGPALKKRDPHIESEFYYAPADRRNHRSWVTVRRDREGIRADVEMLEALIDGNANETELHKFFEQHPAVLMDASAGIPISHRPNFQVPKDNKPDFAISPILGPIAGRPIGLIELKGPAERLLSGRNHRGFASGVHRAVDQVRDYDRYLRNPANAEAIVNAFGYLPDRSRLAVLIGRDPKNDGDRGLLNQRREELGVSVVTYDEILEIQAQQLETKNKPYLPPSGGY